MLQSLPSVRQAALKRFLAIVSSVGGLSVRWGGTRPGDGHVDGKRGFSVLSSAQVSNNPVEEVLEALALLIGKRVAFTNHFAVFVDHEIG